jgi:hypothetical protein
MAKGTEYILVAQGSITIDPINIMISFDKGHDTARAASMRHVKNLIKAGYYRFSLYKTGETDVFVESYDVEIPDPIVTVSTR